MGKKYVRAGRTCTTREIHSGEVCEVCDQSDRCLQGGDGNASGISSQSLVRITPG